ncbi:MAG: hypothetical protein QM796_18435 [Chthoniobacteraceae bacterium]
MKEVLILTFLAVIAKMVEESKRIRPVVGGRVTVESMYDCLNFHLHLTLGMLGLVAVRTPDFTNTFVIVGIVFAGAVSKGAFSNHRPERFDLRDTDMLCGLLIPNALAFLAIVFSLCVISTPPKSLGDSVIPQQSKELMQNTVK